MPCPLCETVQLLQDIVETVVVNGSPDPEKVKSFARKVKVINVFGKNYVIPNFTFKDLADCPLHNYGTLEDFASSIKFLNHPEVIELIFAAGQLPQDQNSSRPM